MHKIENKCAKCTNHKNYISKMEEFALAFQIDCPFRINNVDTILKNIKSVIDNDDLDRYTFANIFQNISKSDAHKFYDVLFDRCIDKSNFFQSIRTIDMSTSCLKVYMNMYFPQHKYFDSDLRNYILNLNDEKMFRRYVCFIESNDDWSIR